MKELKVNGRQQRKGKIMNIGLLEYVVIGVKDQQLKRDLFVELNEIHATGKIRVVDLIFVTKSADGAVVLKELNELIEEEPEAYRGFEDDLMGLLTAQDIDQLTGLIPSNTSALVVIFEHTWVIGLTEAGRKGGGVIFDVGMVSNEALAQVSAELAAKEHQNA
jgi:hypothetical protein